MYNHSNPSISFRYDETITKNGIKSHTSPTSVTSPTMPTKRESRIVLVESESKVQPRKILTPVSTSSLKKTTIDIQREQQQQQQQPRIEKYTLKEIPTTPTTYYYNVANLSYRNSLASTVSSVSTCSTFSDVGSHSTYSTMSSKDENTSFYTAQNNKSNNNNNTYDTSIRRNGPLMNNHDNNNNTSSISLSSSTNTTTKQNQSWSSTFYMYNTEHFPLSMIKSLTPIGWLRSSLSTVSTLDFEKIRNCPHFVLLGFGDTHILMDIFNLKSKPQKDKENATESTFFWKLDQNHQSICTLATIPADGREYNFLENLALNRIGISSILLCLSIHMSANEIKSILNYMNQTLTVLDPQATWWERLVLVFHHGTEEHDIYQRLTLVQDTLPKIYKQLSILPCTLIIPSSLSLSLSSLSISSSPSDHLSHHHKYHNHHHNRKLSQEIPTSIQQQINRILYQQVCMHQLDHGWWHGSIAVDEDSNSSSSEDDLNQNIVSFVGNKKSISKNDESQPQHYNNSINNNINNNDHHHHHHHHLTSPPVMSQKLPPNSPIPSSSFPASNGSVYSHYSQSQLKHRFSKHWKDRSNPHTPTLFSSSSPPPIPVSKFPF